MKSAEIVKALETVFKSTASIVYMFTEHAKDFTRSRKLPFETVAALVVGLSGESVASNLLDYFACDADAMPTASALNQRRDLLRPDVFEFMFQEFNAVCPPEKTMDGWRIIACDGTDINIPYDPADKATYCESKSGQKGFNQLHLSALYDFCEERFLDAVIQPMHEENECQAFNTMIDRFPSPSRTIFVADRGYESYNLMAHTLERGAFFLIRGRDSRQSSIVSGLKAVPAKGCCDCWVHIELSKKQTKEAKARPDYKFVPSKSTFDFLDLHERQFYPLDLRVVRVEIPGGYEVLLTNLPADLFPPQKLKELYFGRWGIESHFRDLKYSCDLVRLHSRKMNFILQEIFASLLFHNYCVLLARAVSLCDGQAKRKYPQKVNFALAAKICRQLLFGGTSPPEAEACMRRLVVPIRSNRSAPRHMATQSFIGFNYR